MSLVDILCVDSACFRGLLEELGATAPGMLSRTAIHANDSAMIVRTVLVYRSTMCVSRQRRASPYVRKRAWYMRAGGDGQDKRRAPQNGDALAWSCGHDALRPLR